jgi:hypothetical protein
LYRRSMFGTEIAPAASPYVIRVAEPTKIERGMTSALWRMMSGKLCRRGIGHETTRAAATTKEARSFVSTEKRSISSANCIARRVARVSTMISTSKPWAPVPWRVPP